MWEPVEIQCPYCFERTEVLFDPQDRGELVRDCEVCCNPWKIRLWRDRDDALHAEVERLQ